MGDRNPEDFGIGRLFRHVRDAVIVGAAKSERIVLWNDCATKIFGYSEEDALRLHLHDLVPARLRGRHRSGLARYQESGSGPLLDSGKPVDLWGLHRDGHEVPIELTLTAIPEVGSESERFALAIVRDASDRRAAEAARRRVEQEDLRRQQALELNDRVVQGLVAAKAAFELGRTNEGMDAISATLDRAKAIVSGLLADISPERDVQPGDLVRKGPASVARDEGAPEAQD